MAQVKIYAGRSALEGRRELLSDAIHRAVRAALGLPQEKRFHRFFPLDPEDFVHPRGERYTILEVLLFEGRSQGARAGLIRGLFAELAEVGVPENDLEITLVESPPENWGIRGKLGSELKLSYKVDV